MRKPKAVLATSLEPAQLIRASSLEDATPHLLSLPSIPEVNLQMESSRPVWSMEHTV